MDEIRSIFPTRNFPGRGLPIASQPTAKDKLIRLVRKVRKKSGKTYYQRAQVSALDRSIAATPLSAKKYVKGVDFSFKYEVKSMK